MHTYNFLSQAIKLLLALLLAVSFSEASLAHTKVTKTVPANEAILKKSPEKIKLVFPEPLKITAFKLLDNQQNNLLLEHKKSLSPIKEKVAVPPTLGPGTYHVIWRGISADGHPIKGQITFHVSP